MFDDLDEALRQLLIREIPVKNGEVDIDFHQPKREWSARVSRPTMNMFLWDVRENQKLRQAQPMWEVQRNPDGTVTQRRTPVRVDVHYMLTAWATEPEDEHRLLGRVLTALMRVPYLPDDLLSEGLGRQPVPITLMVAQPEELRVPTDIWNVIDNEMKPEVGLVVTLAIDPYLPSITPLVKARELRVGQSAVPSLHRLDEQAAADQFWTIGGTLRTAQPLDGRRVRLVVVEQGREVSIQPDGQFAIGRLRAGAYTLEWEEEGRPPRRFPITVPAADYELDAT
jgi:hypothetical protein